MALQEESGPARQVMTWQDEPGIHGTNTGPARRIRTPQDKSGPCGRIRAPGTDQDSRNGSGPREWIRAPGMDQALMDGSRPQGTDQDPGTNWSSAGQIRAPRGELGTCRTNMGPFERIRTPHGTSQGPTGRATA